MAQTSSSPVLMPGRLLIGSLPINANHEIGRIRGRPGAISEVSPSEVLLATIVMGAATLIDAPHLRQFAQASTVMSLRTGPNRSDTGHQVRGWNPRTFATAAGSKR